MKLTPKQRRFVNEYCVDENATQAAIRAGYSSDTARQMGSENLSKPYIAEAIAERMEEVAVAAQVTPEWVVGQWVKIAMADPNDIVQVRRTCCRHCHGVGHHYQWTAAEYAAAFDAAAKADGKIPECPGGFGYAPSEPPNPFCPECGGEGVEDVYVADTRHLRGAARALYAGAERTRNGVKVSMRDKDAAVTNLARYLGMLVDRKEISGPNGTPVALAHLSADDLTDDQLAAILKADEAAE